jgi:type 1 glutamine amidotransferase
VIVTSTKEPAVSPTQLIRIVISSAIAAILVAVGLARAQVKDASTDVKTNKPVRILFVTQSKGFEHEAVNRRKAGGKLAPAEEAMTQLGLKSGLFRVDCTQDAERDVTKENLQNYDIVMFYTTGDKDRFPITQENLNYLLDDWLKQKGHGFIGVHSAADTYKDYAPYYEMLGGTFNGHPWGAGEKVTVTVHDTEHPVSKPWGEEFQIQDEIYRFKNWKPENVRVLMSLNMAETRRKEPYHVPIAWVKEYGDGKVLHMSLGHNIHVWQNPRYMESLLGGIKWILGMEKGNATPNPELSKAEEEKAREVASAAKSDR